MIELLAILAALGLLAMCVWLLIDRAILERKYRRRERLDAMLFIAQEYPRTPPGQPHLSVLDPALRAHYEQRMPSWIELGGVRGGFAFLYDPSKPECVSSTDPAGMVRLELRPEPAKAELGPK